MTFYCTQCAVFPTFMIVCLLGEYFIVFFFIIDTSKTTLKYATAMIMGSCEQAPLLYAQTRHDKMSHLLFAMFGPPWFLNNFPVFKSKP